MESYVEVNEGTVEATRQGCAWWQERRPAFVASGKLHETKPACVVGGVIELGPYDSDDAAFMAEHMIASGMPASAVKVKTRRG